MILVCLVSENFVAYGKCTDYVTQVQWAYLLNAILITQQRAEPHPRVCARGI